MQVERLGCHLGSLNIPFQLCSKLALGIITSEEVIETTEEVIGSSKEVIGPQRRL